MGIKKYNPYTPSRRQMTSSTFEEITKTTPEKSLVVSLKKHSGRNNQVKLQFAIVEAELEQNIESSISKEIRMGCLQELHPSNMIQTEQQYSSSLIC